MAISSEDQKKVDTIMVEARGLYVAILTSEAPASLALAIQKKIPFESLSDVDKVALFKVIVALRKAGTDAAAAAGSKKIEAVALAKKDKGDKPVKASPNGSAAAPAEAKPES